jgi:hypothetical protein
MTGPYDTGRFANVGDISSVTTITDAADVVRRMPRSGAWGLLHARKDRAGYRRRAG